MLELDVKCSECGGSGAMPGEGWPEWNAAWIRAREAGVRRPDGPAPDGPEEVPCGVCDGRQRVPTADGETVLAFLRRHIGGAWVT